MDSQWAAHLKDKQEADQFKANVRSSVKVLDRLHDLVYNKIKNQSLFSDRDYDSPSWALRQADKTGYTRALQDILPLLKLSDLDR